MKEGQPRIRKTLLELLELPEEILLNLTKVTSIGGNHLCIENHGGILKYNEKELEIKINPGILEIRGQELTIRTIRQEDIVVEGKIESITFLKDPISQSR